MPNYSFAIAVVFNTHTHARTHARTHTHTHTHIKWESWRYLAIFFLFSLIYSFSKFFPLHFSASSFLFSSLQFSIFIFLRERKTTTSFPVLHVRCPSRVNMSGFRNQTDWKHPDDSGMIAVMSQKWLFVFQLMKKSSWTRWPTMKV